MDVTHKFTPGTRAVAEQVNQNFDDVKSAVDPLQTDVADIKTQLTSGIILPDGSVDFTRLQSYKTYVVSNATNATPIVITAVGHSFLTGDKVYISGVGGNTAANGVFTITKIGTDTFSLDGSVGNGTFTTNGNVVIYPSADNNLVYKAYVDNENLKNLKNITQIGTCSTASYTVLTGAISWTSGSTTVTGSGTAFLTEIKVGDSLAITDALGRRVASIESNTSLTLETAAGDTYACTGLHCHPHEKNVTLDGFSLITGATIQVTFTNVNIATTPTLNVNGTGAKAIYNEAGTAVSATNPAYFPAGSTVEFTYNGTNWIFKKRVIENYVNGTSWYRVWSDGFHEEGGVSPSGADQSNQTVTLLKAFSNTSYNVVAIQRDGTSGNFTNGIRILSYTTTSFQINYRTGGDTTAYWRACGY